MTDLMRHVSEFEADPPRPTGKARFAAQSRLQDAIDRETGGARLALRGAFGTLSRRLVFRVAIAAAAAVAVTGTAVLTGVHGGRPDNLPRTLNAAQVLQKAADRSRSADSDLPVPRADQYFYTQTYITDTPVGGRTKTWTDESWLSVDGSEPSLRQEHGTIHHDPPLGRNDESSMPSYAELEKWPTDPDKLLEQLGRGRQASGDAKASVFVDLCLLMRGPVVMPPGLQAAAFEALARIPGVRVDHDQVDALGRHGVAVSYPKISFTLVFDRTTYDYLGLRQRGTKLKHIHAEWKSTDPYDELTSLKRMAVVDRISQRP